MCDAEDALTEANVLNNLEPEVWAYLCLLCLDTERLVEAEQAYKYTVKVEHTVTNFIAALTEMSDCQQYAALRLSAALSAGWIHHAKILDPDLRRSLQLATPCV